MRKIFTLFAFGCALCMSADQWRPVVEQGKSWSYCYAESDYTYCYRGTVDFKIEGDSIVNGVAYAKLYSYSKGSETPDFATPALLLRETPEHDLYMRFNDKYRFMKHAYSCLEMFGYDMDGNGDILLFSAANPDDAAAAFFGGAMPKSGSFTTPEGMELKSYACSPAKTFVEGIGLLNLVPVNGEQHPSGFFLSGVLGISGGFAYNLYLASVTDGQGHTLYKDNSLAPQSAANNWSGIVSNGKVWKYYYKRLSYDGATTGSMTFNAETLTYDELTGDRSWVCTVSFDDNAELTPFVELRQATDGAIYARLCDEAPILPGVGFSRLDDGSEALLFNPADPSAESLANMYGSTEFDAGKVFCAPCDVHFLSYEPYEWLSLTEGIGLVSNDAESTVFFFGVADIAETVGNGFHVQLYEVSDGQGNLLYSKEGGNPWAGIGNIDADNDEAPLEYYDMLGRKTDVSARGILIRRQGQTAVKIFR